MEVFEDHSYACVKCHEPLLLSKQNEWMRVGRRHLMPCTGVILRGHKQLLLEEDCVSGKQELASCELQRLQCGNCKSQVGLRCNSAPRSKANLIGKLFLRQDAIEVHGLTATASSSTLSPHGRVARRIQFVVVQHATLAAHTPAELSTASSVSESAPSEPSDRPAPNGGDAVRSEHLQAILNAQAKLIAEVKALRELAATNQRFLRTQVGDASIANARIDQHPSDVPSSQRASLAHHSDSGETEPADAEAEPMIIDTTMGPPKFIAVERLAEQSNDTQMSAPAPGEDDVRLSAPPLDPPPASFSDSDYEPSQPLKNQPLHQPITRNLTRGESHRAPSDLRRSTLEDLHRSQERNHFTSPIRRGGPLRRGFSGGRSKMSPSTPKGLSTPKAPSTPKTPSTSKGKQPERNGSVSTVRDENGNLITSTGKIDGRSLRYKKKRFADQAYKSSPLAAEHSSDGVASTDSYSAVRSDVVSNGDSTTSAAEASAIEATNARAHGGVDRSHQEIMKLVNKGMKAQFLKSSLERDVKRLTKPGS